MAYNIFRLAWLDSFKKPELRLFCNHLNIDAKVTWQKQQLIKAIQDWPNKPNSPIKTLLWSLGALAENSYIVDALYMRAHSAHPNSSKEPILFGIEKRKRWLEQQPPHSLIACFIARDATHKEKLHQLLTELITILNRPKKKCIIHMRFNQTFLLQLAIACFYNEPKQQIALVTPEKLLSCLLEESALRYFTDPTQEIILENPRAFVNMPKNFLPFANKLHFLNHLTALAIFAMEPVYSTSTTIPSVLLPKTYNYEINPFPRSWLISSVNEELAAVGCGFEEDIPKTKPEKISVSFDAIQCKSMGIKYTHLIADHGLKQIISMGTDWTRDAVAKIFLDQLHNPSFLTREYFGVALWSSSEKLFNDISDSFRPGFDVLEKLYNYIETFFEPIDYKTYVTNYNALLGLFDSTTTNETCAICLEDNCEGTGAPAESLMQYVQLTTCHHKFHYTCIKKWLLVPPLPKLVFNNTTCPVCRTQINPDS